MKSYKELMAEATPQVQPDGSVSHMWNRALTDEEVKIISRPPGPAPIVSRWPLSRAAWYTAITQAGN